MTSSAPTHRLKWTWLPDVRHVHDLTVGIVVSDEPPSPEYIVVVVGTVDSWSEVARCDRFLPGALARMQEKAEGIADLLEVVACGWKPFDPYEGIIPKAQPPDISV